MSGVAGEGAADGGSGQAQALKDAGTGFNFLRPGFAFKFSHKRGFHAEAARDFGPNRSAWRLRRKYRDRALVTSGPHYGRALRYIAERLHNSDLLRCLLRNHRWLP